MKKQLLREHHNRQDKINNHDYSDRIKEEGGDFDRGGKTQKSFLSFRGQSVILDLRPFLSDDKHNLLRTLESNFKFVYAGEAGTVSQLMRKPNLAENVKELHEMTRRSIIRADEFVDVVKHPKKNSLFRVIEFRCFLQPKEPFQNPIFKKHFAFRAILVKQP